MNDEAKALCERLRGRDWGTNIADTLTRWDQARYEASFMIERLSAENYKSFTDGMEAAAQICGSLAETTYDDSDAFEAATGCEAAIARVVRDQRLEQRTGDAVAYSVSRAKVRQTEE